jgi:hypothetical protein
MIDKLVKLGAQIVIDEMEEAVKHGSIPFDWNTMGLDQSRPAFTRENGKSMLEANPEHILRKVKAVLW